MLLSCLSSEHTDMATSGLFGSQLALHSRLFQLRPIIELPLVRWASKKAGSSSRNRWNHGRPKHRGWKVKDGGFALAGKILVLQRTLRFHPGLNVGFGRNGTLFALEAGRVMVTCEKVDLNWEHSWVMKNYEGRTGQTFYKKYYNVIPEPQHNRFKLIDKV